MIKEKVYALQRKNYIIKKITVTNIFYDKDFIEDVNTNPSSEHVYFLKTIYKEEKGFNKEYHSSYISTDIPAYKVGKIITKLTILFDVELLKLTNTKYNCKIGDLLEKITKDVIKAMKINYIGKVYRICDHYCKSFVYHKENPKNTQTVIMLYHGTKGFDKNVENRPDFLNGIIDIIKSKSVTKYF